jgi:hypothetical protein
VLEAPNEEALGDLARRAELAGILTARFLEPDLGDQMTAVAFHGDAWRMLSSLPLALRSSSPGSTPT